MSTAKRPIMPHLIPSDTASCSDDPLTGVILFSQTSILLKVFTLNTRTMNVAFALILPGELSTLVTGP